MYTSARACTDGKLIPSYEEKQGKKPSYTMNKSL
ncbi:predicted protein [Plenodomus lingam JN3]|uniref:Predicted protein n=1 Tax=Leptosphaeria maculans (strain JN3 / isolate v23.1.3 / race Av1-4-5-6-7-8) TaxID=985895 RepID=E4ZT75_LEPMJ|nr:predicted protein [Plenodomus lingam JN3]CBX90017.1 predicted protein [Plenodomus lingam JN3]